MIIFTDLLALDQPVEVRILVPQYQTKSALFASASVANGKVKAIIPCPFANGVIRNIIHAPDGAKVTEIRE